MKSTQGAHWTAKTRHSLNFKVLLENISCILFIFQFKYIKCHYQLKFLHFLLNVSLLYSEKLEYVCIKPHTIVWNLLYKTVITVFLSYISMSFIKLMYSLCNSNEIYEFHIKFYRLTTKSDVNKCVWNLTLSLVLSSNSSILNSNSSFCSRKSFSVSSRHFILSNNWRCFSLLAFC